MAKIPSYPALAAAALNETDKYVIDHSDDTRHITVLEMSKKWATITALAAASTGSFDFRQSATPTATATGQTWLDTDDGAVYVSTGTGTGNWGTAVYELMLFGNLTGAIGNIEDPLCEIRSSNGQQLHKGSGTLAFVGPAGATYIEEPTKLSKTVGGANTFRSEQDGGIYMGAAENVAGFGADLSDAVWAQDGDLAVPVQDGTLSSDGTTQIWKLSSADFSASGNHLRQEEAITDTGQPISVSCEFQPGTSSKAKIWTVASGGTTQSYFSIYDMATESWTTQNANHSSFQVKKLAGGNYRIGVTMTLNNTGQTSLGLRISGADNTTIYAIFGQIQDGMPFSTPYINTPTGAAVTQTAQSTLLTTVGNCPDLNSDFTVHLDLKQMGNHNSLATNGMIFALAASVDFQMFIWNNGDNTAFVYWDNAIVNIFSGYNLNTLSRYTITRSGNTLSGYINGVLSGSVTIADISSPDYQTNIGIGNNTLGTAPGYFYQNIFETWKRALTASEIRIL